MLTAVTGSFVASGTVFNSLSGNARNNGSFVITVSPASITVPLGSSSSTTVTLMSINGYGGTVALSAMFTNGSIPATFSNNSPSVPVNGAATSTLILSAPSGTSPASYEIIVVGTGTGAKKTYSSSALLSATVDPKADFEIRADPWYITNVAGFVNSTSVFLTSLNGFNGTVSLTATAPFGFIGVMGGQSPVWLPSGGTVSTSLQISTTNDALDGIYTIVVTGTGGQRSHSAMVTVVVDPTSPPTESILLAGTSFNSGTNLTLYLFNSGNSSVSLESYRVEDSMGNAWVLSSWVGPSIGPGTVGSGNVLIWTSCADCYYTGIFGLFTEFSPGNTYRVTVTTTMKNQFTFAVTW